MAKYPGRLGESLRYNPKPRLGGLGEISRGELDAIWSQLATAKNNFKRNLLGGLSSAKQSLRYDLNAFISRANAGMNSAQHETIRHHLSGALRSTSALLGYLNNLSAQQIIADIEKQMSKVSAAQQQLAMSGGIISAPSYRADQDDSVPAEESTAAKIGRTAAQVWGWVTPAGWVAKLTGTDKIIEDTAAIASQNISQGNVVTNSRGDNLTNISPGQAAYAATGSEAAARAAEEAAECAKNPAKCANDVFCETIVPENLRMFLCSGSEVSVWKISAIAVAVVVGIIMAYGFATGLSSGLVKNLLGR